MYINSVKVVIDVKNEITRYGFSYDFNKGLNIITGHNSSGKSTIISCIYYCLGMEQLLGGNRNLVLDKSLFQEFDYKGKTFQISNSTAELIITNGNRTATLKRYIKSFNSESINKIIIKEADDTSSFYLHAPGDHDREQGFYHWLTLFLGIELPQTYSDDVEPSKPLYLQNIFPCALIEQTKGWSDFFAQMPNFGIKDAKQKLIEFLLQLESLDNELKKDILLKKEKDIKSRWSVKYNKINEISASNGFTIRGIYPELVKNDLKNVSTSSLSRMYEESKDWLALERYISILSDQHAELVKKIKNEEKENTPSSIKEVLLKLQSEIALLNRQLRVLNYENLKEKNKVEGYIEAIKKIDTEIERLDSAVRLDNYLPDVKDIASCPVCDHELDLESRLKINGSKLGLKDSISFLRSQKNLYEIYIKKYKDLNSSFNEISSFLAREIFHKKEEIRNLRKDLSSSQDKNIRFNIYNEIVMGQKINEYKKLLATFIEIKIELKDMVVELSDINENKNELKISDDRDNAKISNFNIEFKKLLDGDKFNYTSNRMDSIIIQNKPPSRLLPVVVIRGDIQTIRLSSSASDFIRAQWAFYLTLLEYSSNHPGFLVLDEPGQHAMNVESMTALLKYSSLSKKQIIMCVSKDTRDHAETANLAKILNNLDVDYKYTLINIDPDAQVLKCVKPLQMY